MTWNPVKKAAFLILCSACFGKSLLFSQESDRYFETAGIDRKEPRIAIFYSHPGSLKSVVEINKKIGGLGLDRMTLVAVYHEREATDFEAQKQYLKANGIDWIKFHKISAPLSRKIIFQTSALSAELKMIFKKSDAVIFFGGYDIPPGIYKQKTSLRTQIVTPFRHLLELSSVFHLLGGSQDDHFRGFLESEPEFPVLGICLGCQTLNVGAGGTLIQDVWADTYGIKDFEEVLKMPKENWQRNPFYYLFPDDNIFSFMLHPIKLGEKGKFCKELSFRSTDEPLVLSGHHQAAGELGKGLKVIATSLDGKVVEALEHERFPNVLGVQFHPDIPLLWDEETKFKYTPDDKEEKSLVSILKANPPSYAFNQKIWSWFREKTTEFHKKRHPLGEMAKDRFHQ